MNETIYIRGLYDLTNEEYKVISEIVGTNISKTYTYDVLGRYYKIESYKFCLNPHRVVGIFNLPILIDI